MKPNKTKLIVKIDPHRNWVVLDQQKIDDVARQLRKKAELLVQAALTPCMECGKPPVVVFNNMLLKVCASCAIKRLNRLFDEGNDDAGT